MEEGNESAVCDVINTVNTLLESRKLKIQLEESRDPSEAPNVTLLEL